MTECNKSCVVLLALASSLCKDQQQLWTYLGDVAAKEKLLQLLINLFYVITTPPLFIF